MENIITVIVSDWKEKDLCNLLKERYAKIEGINIILYSDYNIEYESDIYILVGDADRTGKDFQKQGEIVIDISDAKLKDMTDENNDLSTIRNQILDGITAPLFKDTLIGLDYMDLKYAIQDCNNIFVGIINTKSMSDIKGLVDKVINKAKMKIDDCKKAYLYVEGDISLMELNEIAVSLEESMVDGSNIAFTASYNSNKVDEYYVMVLFGL